MTTNNFTWKLDNKASIYEGIETYEIVDKELLHGFINTGMGISYRDNKRYKKTGIRYENEQKQMLHYLELEQDGYFYTSHKMSAHKWGRIQPTDYLSLCIMHRPTRHTLTTAKYIDIDMVNCHSNIYLSFAKHYKLTCEALTEYCENPLILRNNIINFYFPEAKNEEDPLKKKALTDKAKVLIISLANGGSLKQWLLDNELQNIEFEGVKQIEEELRVIRDNVFIHNQHILQDIIKANGPIKGGSTKHKRTVMSLWSQTIERFLQECAIEFLAQWYPIESIIPCQDGLMLEKQYYYDGLIEDINTHVNSKYSYNTKFECKPLDNIIHIPKNKKLNLDISKHNDDETDFYNISYPYYSLNQKKIDIEYEDFETSDIFIVKSGTGTGKSESIADLYREYKTNHPQTKILCVSGLKTILQQITKTFKKVDVNLKNYLNAKTNVEIWQNDSIMCINSITKITDFDFSDTVLYLDECTDLFMRLCDNETMGNTKLIVATFIDIFKNCKKVVITDAHLTKSVEDLVKLRKTPSEKIYYYVNSYKKFKDKDAISVGNVNVFTKKLIDRVKEGIKFIFSSDSERIAKEMYTLCLSHSRDEDKSKFYLFTAKDNENLDITKINHSDSYIFYSPRVTCGVSIISNTNLDSFQYITGKSIDAITLYQQATRNRTMNKLYYYIENKAKNVQTFRSYETCVEHYKLKVKQTKELLECSTYIDVDEKIQVHENFFFNLYCHRLYSHSLVFKNIRKHFEHEIINAGFKISKDNSICEANYEEEIKINVEIHDTKKIEDLKESITTVFSDKLNTNLLVNRCQYLNISDAEQIEKYKHIIQKDSCYESYSKFEKLLRNKNYVIEKLKNARNDKFDVDMVTNTYYKVLLIRYFEIAFNITPLEIDNFSCVIPNIGKEKLVKLCKDIEFRFRLKKVCINNKADVKSTYLKILKQMIGLEIMKSVRSTVKNEDGKQMRQLQYDYVNMQDVIDLVILKNKKCLGNFDKEIITTLAKHIKIPDEILNKKYSPPSVIIDTIIEYMIDDED